MSLKDTKLGQPRFGKSGELVQPAVDYTAKYTVEYHCTLHSNQMPTQARAAAGAKQPGVVEEKGLRGFYGRTCFSSPKPLQISP